MAKRKLTVAQVREARAAKGIFGRLQAGDRIPEKGPSQKELADKYQVHKSTIYQMLAGTTYDRPGAWPNRRSK